MSRRHWPSQQIAPAVFPSTIHMVEGSHEGVESHVEDEGEHPAEDEADPEDEVELGRLEVWPLRVFAVSPESWSILTLVELRPSLNAPSCDLKS